MRNVVAAAAVIVSIFAPAGSAVSAGAGVLAAPATDAPPPEKDRIGVDVLNVNGSGCKKPTVAVSVSPDNKAFTVIYSGYVAQVGGGAKKNDARKDCRLNLKIRAVPGFAYTILRADYRGFAELGAGASATLGATYSFQGPKGPQRLHSISGPLADSWQATDVSNASALVYGPCGGSRNLSVDTELSVSAGKSDPATTNYVAMDSADGGLETKYTFAWKRC
ncbi:MAG TPA: DUF4360 domain-containing protein [Pilimelia sp.]|nr:DUF4360 domain-containing protein [Pilimelia sp.]